MTRITLPLAVLLLTVASPARAEEKKINAAVVSVVKDEKGCPRDLGYIVQKDGESDKAAGERLQSEFPEKKGVTRSIAYKDNYKKNKFVGTYVVVLRSKTEIKRTDTCSGIGFGVGFGADEPSAKADALAMLGRSWINFEAAKHGVDILLSEKR